MGHKRLEKLKIYLIGITYFLITLSCKCIGSAWNLYMPLCHFIKPWTSNFNTCEYVCGKVLEKKNYIFVPDTWYFLFHSKDVEITRKRLAMYILNNKD